MWRCFRGRSPKTFKPRTYLGIQMSSHAVRSDYPANSVIDYSLSQATTMEISKTDPIIIVGSGAFGLSTALHLRTNGYENVTVLDKDNEVPSRFSAANDLNKIVRAEYEDPFYTKLSLEAIAAWKKPPFAPHFRQVGFLHCVSQDASKKAIDTLKRFQDAAEGDQKVAKLVSHIHGNDDIRDLVLQYKDASLPGWNGYFNRIDGYAHSSNALKAAYHVALSKGVRFVLGKDGAVSEVVYDQTSSSRRATGVKSQSGRVHSAKLVIVASGAGSSKLVPQIGAQLIAKSWSVAHILLSSEETAALRGIPVTYARNLGFLFEPDPETNLLKLCPMGAGYINTDAKTGVSYAPESLAESAFVPEHDEKQIKKLLQQTLPQFADRPLVKKSLCWFADTQDSDFIVDYVPETSKSVVLLSGDSGHGFKMFPIVGSWVKNLLEASDHKQPVERWRWKHINNNASQGSWNGASSWRLGESQELNDIRPQIPSKL